MKVKTLFILGWCCTLWVSCFNDPVSNGNKCGACPLYLEVAPYIAIRIVDKSTGADLFLSPNSPYKLSDLTISSSINGTSVLPVVDSTQKGNRLIRVLSPESQTFTFKLATLTPDSITVTTARDSPVCCPRLRIKRITLDNALVCSPCAFSQLITIKK